MLFANNNKLFNNTVNLIKIFQLSRHFDYFNVMYTLLDIWDSFNLIGSEAENA